MKYLALLMMLASVMGCGNDNNSMDLSVSDASIPDLSGSAGDLNGGASVSDASIPDLSGSAGDPNGGATCDIIAQTGCKTGERCILVSEMIGACAPDGTVAENGTCTIDAAGDDNCKGASYCDNHGPNNTYACRKLCTSDATCTTAGQKCANLLLDSTFGLCLPGCTPSTTNAQGDCPAGNSCTSLWPDQASTMQTPTGFFVCKKDGVGALFEDCAMDTDCGAGLACDLFGGGTTWCAPICDTTHPCPQPPGDGGAGAESCKTFSNTNGIGYCVSM